MKIAPAFTTVAAFAGALLAATPAGAAVSVIGNGIAHDCYIQAEFGTDARAAIQVCTKALKSDVMSATDRASTLINRGILKARTADLDGALTDYAAAIASDENLGEAYLNRSATLIAMRRFADALRDADRAVQLGVKRMEIAYYNRGLANESLGNIKAAYEDYQAALKIAPRFAAASEQLARFRVVREP